VNRTWWCSTIIGSPGGPRSPWKTQGAACERCVDELVSGARPVQWSGLGRVTVASRSVEVSGAGSTFGSSDQPNRVRPPTGESSLRQATRRPALAGVSPAMSVMWKSPGIRASPGRPGHRACTIARGRIRCFGSTFGSASTGQPLRQAPLRLRTDARSSNRHYGKECRGRIRRMPGRSLVGASFRVVRCVEACPRPLACQLDEDPEKRGEPRLAAGCNIPATLSLEKTVEVLGKHEGGTGSVAWQRLAEGSFGSWEWTGQGMSAAGRSEHPVVPIRSTTRLAVASRRSRDVRPL